MFGIFKTLFDKKKTQHEKTLERLKNIKLDNDLKVNVRITDWEIKLIDWANKHDLDNFNYIGITKLNNLKTLELLDIKAAMDDFKVVTKLPNEICEFRNLKKLVIGDVSNSEMMVCKLTELPKCIGKMITLEELHLQYNRLTELPIEICNLSNLRKLKLGGNNLKSLPEKIDQLHNLEILTFWGNDIEKLPDKITNLTSLKGLSFWGNPIEKNGFNSSQILWLQKLQDSGCIIEGTIKKQFLDLMDELANKLNNNEYIVRFELGLGNFSDPEIYTLDKLEQIYKLDNLHNFIFSTDKEFLTYYLKATQSSVQIYDKSKKINHELSAKYTNLVTKYFTEFKKMFNELKNNYYVKIMPESCLYSEYIKDINNSNFEKIRRYCNNLVDEHKADSMQKYLALNGKMHKALIYDALKQFIEKLNGQTITLVDWGCGQGIGTMLVIDYIKQKQLEIIVDQVILIDNDTKAISRAMVHIEALKQNDIEIMPINSDDISELEILSNIKNNTTLNIIVNDKFPIDILEIDFELLSTAYFMCVSNPNKSFIDEVYENISDFNDVHVQNLSIRDGNVGKFERFEKVFLIENILTTDNDDEITF